MSRAPTSQARRWVIGLIALVVGLNLLAALANRIVPSPKGPPSSSYATAPEGLAAYAELLARAGHDVQRLRSAPADDRLDPAETVVVLDPERISRGEVAALRRFAERGGTLLVGGTAPSWVETLVPDPPRWEPEVRDRYARAAPVPEATDVDEVRTTGNGAWRDPGAALPALEEDGAALLLVRRLGLGRVALLADASPLQNRLLDEADNAALGLALAGPSTRPVTFVENVHGFGEQRGIAALPRGWKWALAGLVLAGLAFLWSRARRLGPPEPQSRPLPPPRSAYIDAVAATLARTRRPAEATAPVRDLARDRLARRAGLGPDPGDSEIAIAAERAGLSPEEAGALTGSNGDVMAAGRALARLSGGER